MKIDNRQRLQAMRAQFRRDGYDDGRAGKPARYTLAEYQVSYRRGREAREQDDGKAVN